MEEANKKLQIFEDKIKLNNYLIFEDNMSESLNEKFNVLGSMLYQVQCIARRLQLIRT